jgi:glycosyltransferase involved in cell wall biosynthesis
MKILMATMALDIGGAETHIVELSKALVRRGHEVLIVSNGGVYVPEAEDAGVRHYEAPLHRRAVGEMRRSYGILKEIIQREKPDIVHAHARIPALLIRGCRKYGTVEMVTVHARFSVNPILSRLCYWGMRTIANSIGARGWG